MARDVVRSRNNGVDCRSLMRAAWMAPGVTGLAPAMRPPLGAVFDLETGGLGHRAKFSAAIDVARAQEAKWWELRAATSLSRL